MPCQKTDPRLLFRRINISAIDIGVDDGIYQLDLFTDYEALEKEKKIQAAMMAIRKRYGKNAVVKGLNLRKGGTAIERNQQIGGHKA